MFERLRRWHDGQNRRYSTDERLRDAFQLLADDTRLDVLHALWTAPEWTATFTELKDAVGMRDSGQFQYHLNQLAGTFVRRTDNGYTHLAGGIALYRTMLGAVAGPARRLSVPLDESCPSCGASLHLRYENHLFYARCPDCEETVASSHFPRAGLEDRTDEERRWAFDRWLRRLVSLLRDGVCPWCASTVSHEFESDADDPRIVHTCDRCGGFLRTTVGDNVLDHPAVVSFLYERGVDVTTTPHWRFDFCTSNENVTLVADDPPEVRLAIRVNGDTLVLRVNESGDVIEAHLSADA